MHVARTHTYEDAVMCSRTKTTRRSLLRHCLRSLTVDFIATMIHQWTLKTWHAFGRKQIAGICILAQSVRAYNSAESLSFMTFQCHLEICMYACTLAIAFKYEWIMNKERHFFAKYLKLLWLIKAYFISNWQ